MSFVEKAKARYESVEQVPERETVEPAEVVVTESSSSSAGESLTAADEELIRRGLNPDEWEPVKIWTTASGSLGFSFGRKAGSGAVLPDLDDLHAMIQRSKVRRPEPVGNKVTALGVVADPQVGKTGDRGGTEELLERLETSRIHWEERLAYQQPDEIVLADGGDCIENFESTAQEDRTNDLSLTEQIRVWRRVLASWAETAANYAPVVHVLGVPSNHASVRRGKANMGHPWDDYGIEAIAQVADAFGQNPEKYGHVHFATPKGFSEAIAHRCIGGKVVGLVHGHQVRRIEKLVDWLAGQALGDADVAKADIFITNHFHNPYMKAFGNGRWHFGAPTIDAGSPWYQNLSGHDSNPNILTMVIDEQGWRDYALL